MPNHCSVSSTLKSFPSLLSFSLSLLKSSLSTLSIPSTRMLPFPLLFLLPLLQAQAQSSRNQLNTPTQTSTVTTLVPPYGPGPATYHASIYTVLPIGTVYQITCIEPTASPTLSLSLNSYCKLQQYGDRVQTFTQGPSVWKVSRPRLQQTTSCTISAGAEDNGGLAGWKCWGTGPMATGEAALGLKRQDVVVTGGFEKLGRGA